jgi:hypothetical protein
MMPDQPLPLLTLATEPHTCNSNIAYPQVICTIRPESPHFDRVMIISRDGVIRQTLFVPTDLRVIDLVRHWGRPDSIQQSDRGYYFLRWDAGVFAHIRSNNRFSYLLPVADVLLYNR